MIFRNTGTQKEKCPDCGGTVFCDPIGKKSDILTGYTITCGNCGREFYESEWPPPK